MSDLVTVLKLVVGQKLLKIIEQPNGIIELHFEDFVVSSRNLYVSPIIERIKA